MENLNNVFNVIEEEDKIILKFENSDIEINAISSEKLNNFFQDLSKKYINGYKIEFVLGDEPKKENGDSNEKAFAYEFASSFKEEWDESLENLDNIANAIKKLNEEDN